MANWETAPTMNRPRAYSSTHGRKPKTNHLGTIAIGAAAVAALALIGGGAYWWVSKGRGVSNGDITTNVVNGVTTDVVNKDGTTAEVGKMPSLANLSRPERVDSISQSLIELTNKANQAVASLGEAELQTTGADRLNELEPQLREYFLRAAQATPKSLTMTDAAAKDAQLASGAGGGSAGPQEPPKNYIWTLNGPSDQSDRWGTARYAISQSKYRADVATQSRLQYPDPLKETSGAYDWSPEDRRVLSSYWLQGELERDVATEIIAALRDESSVQEFQDRCFAAIERFYAPVKELAEVKSTQGKVIIREPKATPYARHAKATRYTLTELQEEFPDENVAWVIKQAIYFSDAIEDLQFGRTEGATMYASYPLRERFDKMKAVAEEERQKKLAEEERARQELAKQEEERKAKEAAEQERQRQLAEDAKAKAAAQKEAGETAGDNALPAQAPLAGGPGRGGFGPGFGRPPIGMGANRNGAEPFPSSGPPNASGPSNERNTALPGGPPPGFGQPPTAGPTPGRNPAGPQTGPQGPPPSLGPSVTIVITGSGNLDVTPYLEKLKAALKTGNYQVSQSGNEATIKLGFAGDLKAVSDAIDFGKVESSDPAKRELRVKVE
jgi:hypothetical protein